MYKKMNCLRTLVLTLILSPSWLDRSACSVLARDQSTDDSSSMASKPALVHSKPGSFPQNSVEIREVEFHSSLENSVAPGAFRYVCASDLNDVRTWFLQRRLPFSERVVRQIGGASCHLWYEPTIPRFRADPDNWPVSELYVNVETLSFLAGREKGVGDCLDLTRSIAEQVERPVNIHVGVSEAHGPEAYERAGQLQFPAKVHPIEFGGTHSFKNKYPWVQDYLKSGSVDGQRKILLARGLYEALSPRGERHEELHNPFEEWGVVRSNLSWEGGDLQFMLHPKRPDKLILFYGDAARRYWGFHLSDPEYEYVLKMEFGVDYAVNLGGVTDHIDYFVWFLPEDQIALVAEPLKFDRGIVQAAAVELQRDYGLIQSPFPSISAEFAPAQLIQWRARSAEIKRWIQRLGGKLPLGLSHEVEAIEGRFANFVPRPCRGSEMLDCFSLEAQRRALEREPDLLREWISKMTLVGMNSRLPLCLASIIESQAREERKDVAKKTEDRIKSLQQLGFKVVRIPSIEADQDISWEGISYANGLLIDRKLFVPSFGLGAAEEEIFQKIAQALPPYYQVIPLLARHTMLFNGGIHCIAAIGRERPHDVPKS